MLSYWGSTLESSCFFLPEPAFALTVFWEMLLFCHTRSCTLLLSKLCWYLLSLRWNWRSRGSFSWLCYCYLLPQTQKKLLMIFLGVIHECASSSPLVTTSLSACICGTLPVHYGRHLLTVRCSHVVILVLVIDSQDLSLLQIYWNMQDSCASYLQLNKTPQNLVTWKQYFVTSHVLEGWLSRRPLIWPGAHSCNNIQLHVYGT